MIFKRIEGLKLVLFYISIIKNVIKTLLKKIKKKILRPPTSPTHYEP